MSNRLLEQVTCPNCHRSDDFHVDVLATVHLDANGPSLAGDYFADGDFTCVCLSCNHEDSVFEFTKAVEVQT